MNKKKKRILLILFFVSIANTAIYASIELNDGSALAYSIAVG
jgi:hypothetical protein